MPGITRTQGNAASTTGENAGAFAEHFAGNINWFRVTLTNIHTSYDAVDSDWEKTLKAMSSFGTVVMAGLPAANDAMFGLEGADNSSATVTKMTTDVDAATGGSSTINALTMSGDTWA
jgi:hypothetical protein